MGLFCNHPKVLRGDTVKGFRTEQGCPALLKSPSDQLRTKPAVGLLPITAHKEPEQCRKVVGFAHLGPGGGNDRGGVVARNVDHNEGGMLGDDFRQRRNAHRRPCGFYGLFPINQSDVAPIAPSNGTNEDSPGKL